MHQTLTVGTSPPTSSLIPLSPRIGNIDFQSSLNHSTSGNASKLFMRLNTENKPRTIDRQRPILSKAQSMASPTCTMNVLAPFPHLNQKNGDQQQNVNNLLLESRNTTEFNGIIFFNFIILFYYLLKN